MKFMLLVAAATTDVPYALSPVKNSPHPLKITIATIGDICRLTCAAWGLAISTIMLGLGYRLFGKVVILVAFTAFDLQS